MLRDSTKFWSQIKKFNRMYKLNRADKPRYLVRQDLEDFVDIFEEEVREVDDLLKDLRHRDNLSNMTELADWLGDLVVYCHTFADRMGINLPEVLNVIMESNFSKLDERGEPIYDHRGKVMKGPNYWKPEEKIRAILLDQLNNR